MLIDEENYIDLTPDVLKYLSDYDSLRIRAGEYNTVNLFGYIDNPDYDVENKRFADDLYNYKLAKLWLEKENNVNN